MHATVKRKIWSSPFLHPSEPSKFDKARLKDTLLLLSMKINDESKYILHCKKAFSNVLEDIASKCLLWGKPPDPDFKQHYNGKNS